MDRVRRHPGIALVGLAMIAAAILYAPTLTRGLINYDDPWLIQNNWIVQHPSWSSVWTIFFELHSPERFVLSPEYLPVRDLSVMLDYAIWGSWFQGHHVTNLAIYLASIPLLYAMLEGFGIERTVAGVAALIWALHPSHAESVAWLTERKGLLGAMFALVAGLGIARFRAGRGGGWLAMAMLAAVAAVWSKAPAAFAIAALAGLEAVLPARRVSWRRSLVGLGAIAIVGLAAFVPVVMMATSASVVGTTTVTHAGRLATVLGVHGFYLELAAMAMPNATSYPIATLGPSTLDLAIGALGLVAIVAVLVIPRWAPAPLRAASVLWLVTWIPVSHLVLPLQMVIVADRYALLLTLGVALAVAFAITRVPRPAIRIALAIAICLASALRTLDAQATWSSPRTLWARAVESNPDNVDAWGMFAAALDDAGEPELASAAVDRGLEHGESARLLLRKALLLQSRDPAAALVLFRRAAEAGDPRAMSNLALLELADKPDDALFWARLGVAAAPLSAHGERTLGKVALATHPEEALTAFELAYRVEPQSLDNRYNLGLAYLVLHRASEAIPHLEACVADSHLAARARDALVEAHRQLSQ